MNPSFSFAAGAAYGGKDLKADMGCQKSASVDAVAAARQISDEFPGGIAGLARALDVSASTLEKKLNPNNEQHKLTLYEAVRLQQVSGRRDVLMAMAAQLGGMVVLVGPDQSEGDAVEAFMRFQQELGEFTSAVADVLRHKQCSANAQRRVQAQASELMATIGALVGLSAACVPQRGAF